MNIGFSEELLKGVCDKKDSHPLTPSPCRESWNCLVRAEVGPVYLVRKKAGVPCGRRVIGVPAGRGRAYPSGRKEVERRSGWIIKCRGEPTLWWTR
jgi:hypothetical protein